MPYLEKNLAPGETLMHLGRLHWALFVAPVAVMVVVPVALAFFAAQVHGPVVYAPIALLVIVLFWLLARYLTYISTEFGVTSQRIVMKRGVIGIATREILLSRVEAIQVRQSIWGRILNFGDVIVTGTGGTNEQFAMIAAPQAFRAQVQGQLTGESHRG